MCEWRPEVVRGPGAGAIGSCKLLDMGAGPKAGSSERAVRTLTSSVTQLALYFIMKLSI